MTVDEALQLVRTKARHKYKYGKRADLLTYLVLGLRRGPNDNAPIENRESRPKKVVTFLNRLNINSGTWLMDMLRSMDEVQAWRRNNRLIYMLDLTPLNDIVIAERDEHKDKEKNAERMRRKRAERRAQSAAQEISEIIHKVVAQHHVRMTTRNDELPTEQFIEFVKGELYDRTVN